MRRREFIGFVGGTVAWPLAARAQQQTMRVIGFLCPASPEGYRDVLAPFRRDLNEAGYVEGQNLVIEYRWAQNHFDRLPALAAGLVRLPLAVIVAAGGTGTAVSAKAATATIPIVFSIGGDPIRAGLVASLNRPGGNVTGVTEYSDVLITKRLELTHELVPKAAVVAVLLNPSNPNSQIRSIDVQAAARAIGQQIRVLYAGSEQEFDTVFASQPSSRNKSARSSCRMTRYSSTLASD
jgi:putative ABC transport system substrate-binding protein